jgi:hypothetical protein
VVPTPLIVNLKPPSMQYYVGCSCQGSQLEHRKMKSRDFLREAANTKFDIVLSHTYPRRILISHSNSAVQIRPPTIDSINPRSAAKSEI